MMKHDMTMILHKLPRELGHINIYPLGDLHIGSPQFNFKIWEKWKAMVQNDPNGYVVIIGDLMDNGLKSSKTNSYDATMRPREQKEWLSEQIKDLKGKILGATQGNHEERSGRDSDLCPLYDAMTKSDLEDLYRENMAFVKISLGEKRSDRQYTYVVVLGHGGSRNKVDTFSRSIDGCDAIITGHIHKPSVNFPSKIVIDPRNDVVTEQSYIDLVVPSFLSYGGYGMKAMYAPQANDRFPVLRLSGEEKRIEVTWK